MSGLSCAAPSTSGRCCELGSARPAGGRPQLLAAGQRQPRAGRAALVPLAAGVGRQNSLRNKYKCAMGKGWVAAGRRRRRCLRHPAAAHARCCLPPCCHRSRQQLEKEYFDDWTATTVTSTEEGQRPMTPLTLVASLPGLLRFHIVSAPLSARRSDGGTVGLCACGMALRLLRSCSTGLLELCMHAARACMHARWLPWTFPGLTRPVPLLAPLPQAPAPLRFAVWLVWFGLQLIKERLFKAAVLALTGMEAKTLRRRGGAAAAGYSLRAAALRRFHGKESLIQPLRTVLGR